MGVEGAGGGSRSYRVRVQGNAGNASFVNGWDFPITQSNRHLLLYPNQVMIENPFYARMMAEAQAEEIYFRTLRASHRNASNPSSSRVLALAPTTSAEMLDNIILQNILAQSREVSRDVEVVESNLTIGSRVEVEAEEEGASISSDGDDNDDDDENDVESEEEDIIPDDDGLLKAIADVKKKILNEREKKSVQNKTKEQAVKEKQLVDSTTTEEELPPTFRWVYVEIV